MLQTAEKGAVVRSRTHVQAAVPPPQDGTGTSPNPPGSPVSLPQGPQDPGSRPRLPSRPFKSLRPSPSGFRRGLPGLRPPRGSEERRPGPRWRLMPPPPSPAPLGPPPGDEPAGSAAAALHLQHQYINTPLLRFFFNREGTKHPPRPGPTAATCPPPAPTHRACVKALSPGGTAASPRPEQSTPRSPSQLQEAGQGGGDAPPLGPAQLPRPQATRPSRARHRIAERRPASSGSARPAALRRRSPRTEPRHGLAEKCM